jgi:hypothetical protein
LAESLEKSCRKAGVVIKKQLVLRTAENGVFAETWLQIRLRAAFQQEIVPKSLSTQQHFKVRKPETHSGNPFFPGSGFPDLITCSPSRIVV